MKDLLVLTADQDAEFVLRELLNRMPKVEKIREITFDILRHPQRDPGVANQAVEYVRPYIDEYSYLMILLDHEGSGKESQKRLELEAQMEDLLNKNGWDKRNSCVLLEPELESWVWVNSIVLHDILDWQFEQDIYTWVKEKGFQFGGDMKKPLRPKEAFDAALRKQKIPHSSSVYLQLARKASYKQCADLSFVKFIKTMRMWFGMGTQ